MIDLARFLSTDGFMPHGMCYLWRPAILAVHVGADSLIALTYFTISFSLLYFVRKRAELRFTWIFLSFAIFIVACGASHVMEIWTVWYPMYWLSGGIKVITAIASVMTAILLVKLVPAALRFPTPSALQAANRELAREILERERAEQRVIELNGSLEARVAERTQQLAEANRTLLTSNANFWIASTERKRADDQFRLALEAAPTGMLMMNESGAIVLVNKQIETLFGYHRDELLGRRLEMLVPERFRTHHPNLRKMFFGDPKTRAMGAGRELYGLRKDGTEVPIEIGLNPLQTSEGTFVLSSIADITDRKHAEEGLHVLNAELEQRVKARTSELKERESLLQEVHHRVKNNLQVISSLINMQLRGLEDASSRAALRDCQSRVMTMAQIHEILYQSADYGQVPFAKYANDLTTRILSASGTSPGNIALRFNLKEVSLPVAQAIPCGLILNELVANALKHAFPNAAHGTIRVELRLSPEQTVILSVGDDGIGISPELDLANLNSLGLQLVTTLVEQLEGHVEIVRTPGSTFNISFPLELHT
jgi:two-component system, sensor histidine kinase PdtaS